MTEAHDWTQHDPRNIAEYTASVSVSEPANGTHFVAGEQTVITVSLKDGPAGYVFDTITLVDVADGTADTGKNAVYGYIEADGPLVWARSSDGTTWSPAGTTLDFDCTFVQGGAEVARVAWRLTRDTNGLITCASTTHTLGDLNGSRVTVTEVAEGTQVMTVKFAYSNAGYVSLVAETAYTSMAGVGGTGPTGPAGASGLTLQLSRRTIAT